jgi:hypothetical protein
VPYADRNPNVEEARRRAARRDSPRAAVTRWLFLRLLALVALFAFVSYAVQIRGLVGSHGLLPATEYMERANSLFEALPESGRWVLPTLCWAGCSDVALLTMAWLGAALAALLLLGFAQKALLATLWALYLSLVVVGQTFLSFQWDSLLLEALLLSLFVAPWSMRPRAPWREPPPDGLGLFLLRLLLFKLMFLSGVVKLLSLDAAWWELGALDVHYYTQPLPTWTSWYAHLLPAWFQRLSVAAMFAVELLVPFLVFAPRRLRIAAFVPLVGFQLLIAATGNYGFFNLLTIVLCVPLLDDRFLALIPWLGKRLAGNPSGGSASPPSPMSASKRVRLTHRARAAVRTAAVLVLAGLSLLTIVREMVRTYPDRSAPSFTGRALGLADRAVLGWGQQALLRYTDPFRSINGYGLFRAMTVQRGEIVVEVSADGERWTEVPFRWKPGDPGRRPRFTGPHMPRLDWQMWFAALDPERATQWLVSLARALLQGEATVLDLLDRRALPDEPVRQVRFRYYDYRFATPAERRSSSAWWVRSLQGELFARPIALEDFAVPAGE